MAEQIGVALPATAYLTASGLAKMGLTVTVDVWRYTPAGVATSLVTGASAAEIGSGWYGYTLAANLNTAEGLYVFTFRTSDTTVDQREIGAGWDVGQGGVEYLDAAISTRAVPGSLILATAPPVNAITGDVRIYAGDDYDVDDAHRGIAWTSETWPDLTGATLLTMTVRHAETDAVVFSLSSDESEPELDTQDEGTPTQQVRVLMLPRAKSVLLVDYGRHYKADVSAVLANGNVVALVDARVIAAQKQTRT